MLSKNMKEIAYSTFSHCSSLQRVALPNGINVIKDYAFAHCQLLEEIRIPITVKSVERNAFANCNHKLNIIYERK